MGSLCLDTKVIMLKASELVKVFLHMQMEIAMKAILPMTSGQEKVVIRIQTAIISKAILSLMNYSTVSSTMIMALLLRLMLMERKKLVNRGCYHLLKQSAKAPKAKVL